MKKYLLSVLFALFGISVYAQTEPAITLTIETDGKERLLEFAMTEAGHKLQIDWGDGVLTETTEITTPGEYGNTTAVAGIPTGEGVVKIYGDGIVTFRCSSHVNGMQVTSIDVTKATSLTELTVNTNKISQLDVSKNINLKELQCYNNPITELNLSANTQLEILNASTMNLSSIDVSLNTKLKTLQLGQNKMKKIDVKANTALTTLQVQENELTSIDLSANTLLKTVSVQKNKLQSLDLTMCESLAYVYCQENQISNLEINNVKSRLTCNNNNLTLATLPTLTCKTYNYTPQNAMPVMKRIWPNEKIDLSSQDNIVGFATEAQKTTYVWKTADGELQEGTDYTVDNGVFTFLKAIEKPVYCEMTTAAFPKFTADNAFKTDSVTVESEPELYLTLTAQTNGNDRNLTFASTTAANRIIIDWGDGNRIVTDTIALEDEYGTTTTVTGKPTGDGTIKIYAREISVFGCDSHVDGPHVTAINTSAATELKELNVYTNALTTLDVSKNTKLEELNCYNNPITELDLSANTALNVLDAKNMKLAKIDLTKNTALTKLTLNENLLTEIDLSLNTELKSLYLLKNKLSAIDLSNNKKLEFVNLNENQLTSLDVTACEVLNTLFCISNQLTELKADQVTKSVNCSKNNFTLATLPALTCKTFRYAPQNAMEIAAEVTTDETVDLSAQNHITGLKDSPQTTIYTWMTEDGTPLVAGTDYTEENGVFTFLKKQENPVYCEMTTDAFPSLSGSNTFKTTTILVKAGNSITHTRDHTLVIKAARGNILLTGLENGCHVKVYNLSGQAVAEQTATDGSLNFNIKPGLYIVKVNQVSRKVNAL